MSFQQIKMKVYDNYFTFINQKINANIFFSTVKKHFMKELIYEYVRHQQNICEYYEKEFQTIKEYQKNKKN